MQRRVAFFSIAFALGAALPAAGLINNIPMPANTTNIPMQNQNTAISPAAFSRELALLNKPKLRPLAHHWAIGIDAVPGMLNQTQAGMVAVPNALSARYWATDSLGLDLLASGHYSSQEAGTGVMAPVYSTSPGNAAYGAGLGIHYNLAEANHDLLAQLIVKATGAQAAEQINGLQGKVDSTTLALFVGAGFEAFVPGWDWISVEGSAGVTAMSQSLTPQSPASVGAQTLTGIGIAGSGYSPFNLSLHIYF